MTMKINRRSFLHAASAAAAAPLLGSAQTENPAVITTSQPSKLRLLAVTDLHYFWRPQRDPQTSEQLLRYAERWQPDAVINCGDFWMNNPDGRGLSYCEFAAGEIEKLGLPWALARGNHDQVSPEHEAEARRVLASAPHSLCRGSDTGDCYRVEVRSPGEPAPFWNIYLMNNAYPELHGFHEDQLAWFSAEAARVRSAYNDLPAFAFFHIPLIEFGTIVKDHAARGIKLERVDPNEGSPGAFERMKKENQVRAMFCGHNHLDNYHGNHQGIHLEFLRATGQGGYGRWQVPKGATLIELDLSAPSPHFTTATVMPSGRKFTYRMKVMF